jgi:hypothetical protein
MVESKDCPGCGVEMCSDTFDGNYRVYECPENCEIVVKSLVTSDPDSDCISVEDLNNLSDF